MGYVNSSPPPPPKPKCVYAEFCAEFNSVGFFKDSVLENGLYARKV